ncbi:MAG: DUF3789 domain-containing protein [Halanaerobiales bacterium]
MPYWSGIVLAFMLGGIFGVALMCLVVASGRADEQTERRQNGK